jgi:hypothetical protein
VIVVLGAVVETTAVLPLKHVNVVTIAVTQLHKAVQEWVQELLDKAVKLLDQLKQQLKCQLAVGTLEQSLDTLTNGNYSRSSKSS